MGMFDTIRLEEPLRCPECGAAHSEIQTHEFGDIMAVYGIGSVLSCASVYSGIIKESLWCSACHKAGKESNSPVFVVVWHSVLVAVEQDLARAEARLREVDRLDLIGWLNEAQRRADRWERCYYSLFGDVRKWQEHLAREAEPEPGTAADDDPEVTRRRAALLRLWGLPDEILQAPDPLAAILEEAKVRERENRYADDGEVG
jgi:hypothetical protein